MYIWESFTHSKGSNFESQPARLGLFGRLVCLSEQVSQFTWTIHCCSGMPSGQFLCSDVLKAVQGFLGLDISIFRTHSWVWVFYSVCSGADQYGVRVLT